MFSVTTLRYRRIDFSSRAKLVNSDLIAVSSNVPRASRRFELSKIHVIVTINVRGRRNRLWFD